MVRSDWSSDVCSSDLQLELAAGRGQGGAPGGAGEPRAGRAARPAGDAAAASAPVRRGQQVMMISYLAGAAAPFARFYGSEYMEE